MSGYVYVVESSSGLFKVGYSKNPKRRLTMLRTSTADRLTLFGVVPAEPHHEKELHQLLAPWRVTREWFRRCKAMQPLLDGLRPLPSKKAPGTLKDFGGTRLAARLRELDPEIRLTSQAISQWKRVPAERVLLVEAATGISRHDLRPDLYPVAERAS